MVARCDNGQPNPHHTAAAVCDAAPAELTAHMDVQCVALSCNTFVTTTCMPCTACMQARSLKDCDGLVASLYKHLWLKNQQGRTCSVNIPQTVRRMSLANTQRSAQHNKTLVFGVQRCRAAVQQVMQSSVLPLPWYAARSQGHISRLGTCCLVFHFPEEQPGELGRWCTLQCTMLGAPCSCWMRSRRTLGAKACTARDGGSAAALHTHTRSLTTGCFTGWGSQPSTSAQPNASLSSSLDC